MDSPNNRGSTINLPEWDNRDGHAGQRPSYAVSQLWVGRSVSGPAADTVALVAIQGIAAWPADENVMALVASQIIVAPTTDGAVVAPTAANGARAGAAQDQLARNPPFERPAAHKQCSGPGGGRSAYGWGKLWNGGPPGDRTQARRRHAVPRPRCHEEGSLITSHPSRRDPAQSSWPSTAGARAAINGRWGM